MFFKRKEKEIKPLPEDATTFQKLMHNKRTRSAMILGMYMFGILILILFINFAPKRPPITPENQTITLEQKKENLLNSSYNFAFEIITPELNVNFWGEKKDDIITGFKRVPNQIIEFKIENGIIYNTLSSPPEEINNFFEGINPDYLNLDFIFDLLLHKQFEIKIREYIFEQIILPNEVNLDITIITDRNNIIEIELKETINDKESIYNLKFTNIV